MTQRLRFEPPCAPFHIALVNPEIPQNTGNIARLCAATGSVLHLVGKLGFRTDEKAVRRAGLDYWHLVDVQQHSCFDECIASIGTPRPVFTFTTRAQRSYLNAPFQKGAILVFGSESTGLPQDVLDRPGDHQVGIPTVVGSVRSLNLANAVSAALYEALRVTGAIDSSGLAP